MGRTYNTHEGDEKFIWENLKGRNKLEEVSLHGSII
jgi:hypothetical protein